MTELSPGPLSCSSMTTSESGVVTWAAHAAPVPASVKPAAAMMASLYRMAPPSLPVRGPDAALKRIIHDTVGVLRSVSIRPVPRSSTPSGEMFADLAQGHLESHRDRLVQVRLTGD